jgi:hypothetical protein
MDRRSHLIAERLEAIVDCRESGETAAIRGFLKAWRKATEGENPAGFTPRVRVVPQEPKSVINFAEIPIVGRVKWLPVLVVPMTHHFTQIMRECGDLPLFSYGRVRRTDAWGPSERPRKPSVMGPVEIEPLSVP